MQGRCRAPALGGPFLTLGRLGSFGRPARRARRWRRLSRGIAGRVNGAADHRREIGFKLRQWFVSDLAQPHRVPELRGPGGQCDHPAPVGDQGSAVQANLKACLRDRTPIRQQPRAPAANLPCVAPQRLQNMVHAARPLRRQRQPQRPDRDGNCRQHHQPGAERSQEIDQRLGDGLAHDPPADPGPRGVHRLRQTQMDEAENGEEEQLAENDGAPAHLPAHPPGESQQDAAQDHRGNGDERAPAQEDAHRRRPPAEVSPGTSNMSAISPAPTRPQPIRSFREVLMLSDNLSGPGQTSAPADNGAARRRVRRPANPRTG